MPLKTSFTGDISDLQRSTRAARDEFRQVGAEAGKTSRELRAAGSAFDGTKLEGQALRAVRGIERIGGVTRLTDTEIRRNSHTLSELLQKYDRMGVQAPAALLRVNAELQKQQLAIRQTGAGLGAAALQFGPLNTAANRLGISLHQGLAVAGVGAATALSGALVATIAKTVQYGGEISDIAVKAGVSAEAIQELGFVASQSGNTMEQVTGGLQRMARNLVEGTTQTKEAIAGLGLSIESLRAQQPDRAFQTIAERIAAIKDPMARAAAAMQIFGRAGAELLPTLTSDIEEARQKARDLGLVMSNEMVAASDELADTWDRLADGGAGLLRNAVSPLIPRLRELAEVLESVNLAGIGPSVRFGVSNALEQAESLIASIPGASLSPLGLSALAYIGNARSRVGLTQQDVASVLGGVARAGAKAGGSTPAIDSDEIEERARAEQRLRKAAEDAARAAEKLRQDLQRLTGADRLAAAEQLADNINKVGAARIPTTQVEALAQQLMVARDMAQQTGQAISDDVARALNSLPIQSSRVLGINTLSQGLIDMQSGQLVRANTLLRGSTPFMTGGIIPSTNPLSYTHLPGRMSSDMPKLTAATRDWRVELQGVAQAFGQLAQVAGPSLDGVSRTIGTALTSANAANELLKSLDKTFEKFDANSAGARALGGGLAGLTSGLQAGSLFTNRGAGFAAGAGAGALAGTAFGPVGAGVGAVVGGAAGLFQAGANAKNQRRAKDAMASQLVAEYGTLNDLLETVSRVGLNPRGFLDAFYGSPVEFARAVSQLNEALARERREAEQLAQALRGVSAAHGVLSLEQVRTITGAGADGPAGEVLAEFLEEQRGQTLAGIVRAAEALARMAALTNDELEALTEGLTDGEERQRRIEEALRARAGSVMGDVGQSVQATAAAIFVAVNDALASGQRLVDVLQVLGPAIATVRDLFERSGQAPGAGFAQVASYQRIANDPQAGAALEVASGLGQALAGLANTGLLSPELFEEMANGIGAAYKQMENLGMGGLDAARLMQPALQAIWQMVQDYPGMEDQLDDDTRALLDFAAQSGLIGDKFRPAVDRMIDGVNRLIERLDAFIDRMGDIPGFPTVPGGTPGTPGGGGGGDTPGGGGGEYPNPGGLATGGIVTRPTLSWIGEGGEPEAVIPLSRWHDMAGPQTQTITVQVGQQVIARAAVRGMPREFRMVGV